VLAVDYRGFGASTGRPSEQGLYRDADAALRVFEERFRSRACRSSTGGGRLARRSPPTPPPSARRTRWCSRARSPTSSRSSARNPVMRVLHSFPATVFRPRASSSGTTVRCSSSTATPTPSSRSAPAGASSRRRAAAQDVRPHPRRRSQRPARRQPVQYWRAVDTFVCDEDRERTDAARFWCTMRSAMLTRRLPVAVRHAAGPAALTTRRVRAGDPYASSSPASRRARRSGAATRRRRSWRRRRSRPAERQRWRDGGSILVVTEASCSDSVATVPYLAKLVEGAPGPSRDAARQQQGGPRGDGGAPHARTAVPPPHRHRPRRDGGSSAPGSSVPRRSRMARRAQA
jgi:hypothetical protein